MPRLAPLACAILLIAPPALADGEATPFPDVDFAHGQQYRASDLMGVRVHVPPAPLVDADAVTAEGIRTWDDIGEIGDVMIGADGTLTAVVVDVGGFLGLREKEVAVAWSALIPAADATDGADFVLGLNATLADLEAAPEVTGPDGG
ncbi:PRC-barrel domain-containing protein [Jannaschia sp. LMIT008]|uniref:PRC-barrel domain-containing protein n=1 Tax=Jannaschia maritima TaxID=3032585 RepID=UPI0028127F75|nr:PRC-barrel domain-containing protein [Jannaschia sp. LMIT008]